MAEKAVEEIRALDISDLPQPFRVNDYTIVTDIKLFIEATIKSYENAVTPFSKDIEFDHLKEFYKAVKEYKKNPENYIPVVIKVIPKIYNEPKKQVVASKTKSPVTKRRR